MPFKVLEEAEEEEELEPYFDVELLGEVLLEPEAVLSADLEKVDELLEAAPGTEELPADLSRLAEEGDLLSGFEPDFSATFSA